ncbi:DUF998 domain-containing protein [Agreia pratensis]|uniref:DUF998 domain-containing protein n=1 Tax=Agreia pratensis TaxID=150121 RepID=UPI002B270172|nr:DUF998 domain-containing protein [Agreia pratensis]
MTFRLSRAASPRVARPLLVVAAVAVLVGLALLWGARIAANRFIYVSELGADGEPTAWAFRWALLLVAVAALIVAAEATTLRSRMRILALITPSVSLLIAGSAFALASQITCTSGCPLPVGDSFTWQDFTHTVIAVIGFAAACIAMLQVATARDHPRLARYSMVSAVVVAVVSGAGGILSLARFMQHLGGLLEFAATTVALLWLAILAVALFAAVPSWASVATGCASPVSDRVG